MAYCAERDLGLCGLACVLCGADCMGCKPRGRAQGCDCSIYRCAMGKGLDGCYQCEDVTCGEDRLAGVRVRAFNRYAALYGKRALLARLKINADNGVAYHKTDGYKGDYDLLADENDILRLIHYGTHDPYDRCPVLETGRFTLRLVRMEDADALLECYSDPASQAIFNADNCTSDFLYSTMGEMEACLDFFLINYGNRGFIRFAILDRETERAVGTAEIFRADERADGRFAGCGAWGVLRLDLASRYERRAYLDELLCVCTDAFYGLLDVSLIVTKAIPAARERVAALSASGYTPYEWPDGGRKDYWAHRRGDGARP